MIGQTISHYKILEKLGEGGMGVVYKAQDIRLDRVVALKFLPANVVPSPEDIIRFEREAKAFSALNHPNIASIYDIDEADGKKFLALEYVPGGTLKSKLKKLRSDEKEFLIADVLDTGIQIAEGLVHAHRHQIVHRDIKSDNIMLTDEGKVKITDFGLAKLRGNIQITKTGSTIGTLAYMAPEQLRGEEIDHRADLFSLGVVLYEILTTRLPFRGEHEAALTYSIANEDPIPVQSLRKNVPPALSEVITNCLQKERELRYQQAEDVLTDLRALQQERTPSARAVVVRQPSKLPWIIAACMVLIGVIAAYLFIPASHAAGPNRKTIAVLPFINVTDQKEDEYFVDGITEDILAQLTKISDLKVISHFTMMQYKGSRKSLKEIGKELNAGVALEGSVRRAGDSIRISAQLIDANTDENLWADMYDRENKQVFAIQSEIARRMVSSLQAKLLPAEQERIFQPATKNTEAYNAYLQGRYYTRLRTKEGYEQAITYYETALRLDSNYALVLCDLALAHTSQADYGYEAIDDSYLAARQEAQKALAISPNLAMAHLAMAWIQHAYDWDWARADASIRKALDLEPGNPDILERAAFMKMTLGRFDESIGLYHKSLELAPSVAKYFDNFAFALYNADQWAEAERAARRALELDPQYPSAHYKLGLIYMLQSKPEKGFDEMQAEPDQFQKAFGLSLVYHTMKKRREADSVLAVITNQYQSGWAFQIGEIYAYRGENDKAFEWLDRAYRQHDGGLTQSNRDPLLRNIEDDPRFAELYKKMKMPLPDYSHN